MERALDVSHGDLLAALAEMQPSVGEGLRTAEIADAIGISATSVRKLLRQLKEAGRLELVNRNLTDLCGRQATVIAYRLKQVEDS